MEEIVLKNLEQRIKALLKQCQALTEDNGKLKASQEKLIKKQKLVTDQVEAMVLQLKAFKEKT